MTRRIGSFTLAGLALLWSGYVAAAALETVAPEEAGMSSARLDNLKERFEQLLEEEKTGGLQLLVARRGKVVMYEHLGYADVEEATPVTDETLFRIYSMTKPIVSTAMMMLYEEGVFSLGDPLSKHIPEFADLEVYAGENEEGSPILEAPKREPTIQDLLRHTAGFSYFLFGDTPVGKIYVEKDIGAYDDTLETMIDKLASTPLAFHPGERWHYSVAVDIQGYLIEQWTGMPLGDFLEERLFEPLGMDQTMAWAAGDDAALLADVYTHDEDGNRVEYTEPLATNHFRAPGGFSGGAQLVSSSDDYWRFCQMLLNGGEFEGRRYLSPLTVDMMRRDRLPDGEDVGGPGEGRGFGFGFGVVTDPTKGEYPVGDGEYFWGGLASTVFWIDPEEDLVAIALTQYLPWSGPFYDDLFHRLVRAAVIE